jgi:hypothetical protein
MRYRLFKWDSAEIRPQEVEKLYQNMNSVII